MESVVKRECRECCKKLFINKNIVRWNRVCLHKNDGGRKKLVKLVPLITGQNYRTLLLISLSISLETIQINLSTHCKRSDIVYSLLK